MTTLLEEIYREPHIFKLTLSFQPGGGTKIVVVSDDATYVYVMESDDYWVNQFPAGSNKIYVKGYYDNQDCQIYLGDRVEDPLDW